MKIKAATAKKLEQSITQYTILLILILIIGAYFAYQNYNNFSKITSRQLSSQQKVITLQKKANKDSSNYNQIKKDFEKQNKNIYIALDSVLPLNEDFTSLARTLDKYFLDNTNSKNSLFLSDLTFNISKHPKNKDYSILPFTMTITGSYHSFQSFLQYIQASGDLNNQTRLMDFNMINLSLTKPTNQQGSQTASLITTDALSNKDVSASVDLNAYFKKQTQSNK